MKKNVKDKPVCNFCKGTDSNGYSGVRAGFCPHCHDDANTNYKKIYKTSETAWLIECNDVHLWIGISECGKLTYVTAQSAIRFSRQIDAEQVIQLLDIKNVRATEHIWH